MSHIVEIKLTYRVDGMTSNESAERAVKALLFNSGDTWHDENHVNVTKLSQRTVTQEEDAEW